MPRRVPPSGDPAAYVARLHSAAVPTSRIKELLGSRYPGKSLGEYIRILSAGKRAYDAAQRQLMEPQEFLAARSLIPLNRAERPGRVVYRMIVAVNYARAGGARPMSIVVRTRDLLSRAELDSLGRDAIQEMIDEGTIPNPQARYGGIVEVTSIQRGQIER